MRRAEKAATVAMAADWEAMESPADAAASQVALVEAVTEATAASVVDSAAEAAVPGVMAVASGWARSVAVPQTRT